MANTFLAFSREQAVKIFAGGCRNCVSACYGLLDVARRRETQPQIRWNRDFSSRLHERFLKKLLRSGYFCLE